MINKSLMAASLWSAASFVLAEVEIVDRPVGGGLAQSQHTAVQVNTSDVEPVIETETIDYEQDGTALELGEAPLGSASSNSGEMFYQIQVMQQELLELRGLVEEQSYQIKQLKQQRLDDYVDLDRRISAVTGGALRAASSPERNDSSAASSANTTQGTVVSTAGSTASEMAHYKSATKLILADKNYDEGVAKLKEHLRLYPQSRYAGNSMYWLGEVYMAKSELDSARQWFERLLNDSPLHPKALDAKYKLGLVYHKLGVDQQAKALLNEAAAGSGNAAKLAQSYLKANF